MANFIFKIIDSGDDYIDFFPVTDKTQKVKCVKLSLYCGRYNFGNIKVYLFRIKK